jgi:hypothetical protein
MDTPLNSFTLLVNKAIIGLSPKALLLISFPSVLRCPRYAARERVAPAVKRNVPVFREFTLRCSAAGKVQDWRSCSIPGKERRLIFPGWLTFGVIWRWNFPKPCPAIAGHPKGLGLGKISQVDYAPNEPAGETSSSGSRSPCFSAGMLQIAGLTPSR